MRARKTAQTFFASVFGVNFGAISGAIFAAAALSPAAALADVVLCIGPDHKFSGNCESRSFPDMSPEQQQTFAQMASALALTIVIEALVLRYGLKQKGQTINIALINMFTNPLANIIYAHGAAALGPAGHAGAFDDLPRFFLLAAIELGVVAVEAQLLRLAGVPKPWKASLVLNVSSLVIGGFLLGQVLGTDVL